MKINDNNLVKKTWEAEWNKGLLRGRPSKLGTKLKSWNPKTVDGMNLKTWQRTRNNGKVLHSNKPQHLF